MFIITAKVPKRRYFLLGALAVLVVIVAVLALRGGSSEADADEPSLKADTNAARVDYLASLGWEVDPEPVEALRLTLPDELVEPYLSYNALQLRQGFDLEPYCGETLERYTYNVTNYPEHPTGCQADLYLFDGEIVAGDVVCTGENGFISTLDRPESVV